MLKDLMHNEFLGELTEGEHSAILTNYQLVDGKTPETDYLKISLVVENAGKTQNYSRNLFERDVSIMLSHLRRQLGKQNESISPLQFLKSLIETKTKFNVYINYPTVVTRNGMRRVQNLNFMPPQATPAATSTDTMEVPEGV